MQTADCCWSYHLHGYSHGSGTPTVAAQCSAPSLDTTEGQVRQGNPCSDCEWGYQCSTWYPGLCAAGTSISPPDQGTLESPPSSQSPPPTGRMGGWLRRREEGKKVTKNERDKEDGETLTCYGVDGKPSQLFRCVRESWCSYRTWDYCFQCPPWAGVAEPLPSWLWWLWLWSSWLLWQERSWSHSCSWSWCWARILPPSWLRL